MKRFGIRQQMALLTVLPLALLALGLEFIFLYDRFGEIDRNLLERGELVSKQLASSSEYGVFSNNHVFLQDIADRALQQKDIRAVLIVNQQYDVLVNTGRFSGKLDKAKLQEVAAFSKENQSAVVLPQQADSEYVHIYHPIVPAQIDLNTGMSTSASESLGAVVVEASKLRGAEQKRTILWLTLLTTLSFLSIPLFLVYRASRGVIDPIREMSAMAEAIGRGDLTVKAPLDTRVIEIYTLAQGMNEMVAQISRERAILQQKIDDATKELRAKKETAERASYDKSHFLAVASHDLRQPLHALGLYVMELKLKIKEGEHRHLVLQVEQSVDALTSLLNALLDISKLDAGGVTPQLQICDVSSMLSRVVADFQPLADSKNILLVVRRCNKFVASDRILLERILSNLVSNAIRYTQPNGCVMVTCRKRGERLRIEVRDNGIGISKDSQKDIYREFVQLKQAQLNPNKGLGLGLAIVDRLARLLGHQLYLRSEVGKGSVFAIEVKMEQPRPSVLAQRQHDEIAEHSVLSGIRVLTVDDDASVLSGTSSLLTSWGCHVDKAESLTEVKRLLQDGGCWNLILSDYQLGDGKTGMDVFAMVQQQLGSMPCVLITGETGQRIVEMTQDAGIALLYKPVKPAKLRSLLIYLMDNCSV